MGDIRPDSHANLSTNLHRIIGMTEAKGYEVTSVLPTHP